MEQAKLITSYGIVMEKVKSCIKESLMGKAGLQVLEAFCLVYSYQSSQYSVPNITNLQLLCFINR